MTLVATAVKNHMFASSSLFPNRLRVLTFVFLNAGGGYRWDAQGELSCIYGLPTNVGTMAMDDLNQYLVEIRTRSGGQPTLQEANLELQQLQRAHRAKYIDLYATDLLVLKYECEIFDSFVFVAG